MGMPCLSKPLNLFRQKSTVTVHPQGGFENGHPSPAPKSEELELAQRPCVSPPALRVDPGQDEAHRQQSSNESFVFSKPQTDRLIVVCPSSSDPSTNVTTSRVSTATPRSPVQSIAMKVSNLFSSPKLSQDNEKAKRPQLNRHASKASLIRRRSKTSSGKRVRSRTPSMVSDTSSMLCLSDGLAGLYALASLTAYETKLLPVIWRSCLEQNEYYCEHVLSRLFNRYPELEDMFNRPGCPFSEPDSEPKPTVKREIIQEKSDMMKGFLDRLILTHELDYDRLSQECENFGRSHAVYYYERGLQPYHWDAFAISVVQEYRKTNMNADMGTDEKELQQLAWTHFTTAVVSAIKESFEDELQRMTPVAGVLPGDNGSNAGEKTAFRF